MSKRPPLGPKPARRPLVATAVLGLLALASVGLAGCGDHYDDDDAGYLYLWNRTDTTTDEFVTEFHLAPDGEPLSGNILDAPLPPGDEDYIGTFHEDIWDAEAWLELGDIVDFFNFFIGDHDDTVLEAF